MREYQWPIILWQVDCDDLSFPNVQVSYDRLIAGLLHEDLLTACRLYPDPYCRSIRSKLAEINSVSADEVLVDAGADNLILLALR